MGKMIYADNAATTKLDKDAFEAMVPWMTEEYGNASQPYSFSRAPKKALAEARRIIAKSINAQPEEIFFTSGGTESDNWAIKGSAFLDEEKRATITSAIEHHAVLRACEAIERLGYPVAYLRPDSTGIISPETLESVITDRTRLVSIMYSNNEIGTIEPIKELVKVAHKHGAMFHTDAVQAIGHTNIDVRSLDVDMLSGSAHKFNGPKGVGFLFIRHGLSLAPFVYGGSQESGFRAGTENIPAVVGMSIALKNNCESLTRNEQHILHLEEILFEGLTGLDYIHNGTNHHIPGKVSLSIKNADGEAILHRMDLKGICISTGSACDSVNSQASHVIRAIGVPSEYALGTIRISLGKDNTEEEVKFIAQSITQILKK